MAKRSATAVLLLSILVSDVSSAGSNRFPRPSDGSGGPTCRLVPFQYPAIQRAIDAAFDGDTVLVGDDVYLEHIRFRGKAITLASYYLIDGDTSHISNTIIDGSRVTNPDSASVVYFIDGEDTNSVLCGFTITRGRGTMHHYPFETKPWYRLGGGIYCYGSGPRIVRNIITGNRCVGSLGSGGGIKVLSESPETFVIIEGNLISENEIHADTLNQYWSNKGAGASVRVSARIENNIFQGNFTQSNSSGGAGLIFGQMDPSVYGPLPSGVIRRNIFRDNRVATPGGGSGGGLYLHSSGETIVAENLFVGNSCSYEGGAVCVGTGDPAKPSLTTIENNIIAQNSAAYGGGIATWNSKIVLINNTIVDNNGAGIFSWDWSSFVLMNNIIWGNTGVQLGLSQADHAGHCYNNDVQGGWPGVGTMSAEPRFVKGTYSLSDSSECIGAGIQDAEIEGTMYRSPSGDIGGSSRPDPPGSQPDLGAWEHPLPLGAGIPAMAITPEGHDFLNVTPGSVSDTASVVVRNRGTAPMEIRSLTFGRSEFGLAGNPQLPITLNALARAELGLVFRPTLPGVVVEDTLIVGTSDFLAPQLRTRLKGRGSGAVHSAISGVLYGIASKGPGNLDLYEIDRTSGHAARLTQCSPVPKASPGAVALRGRDTLMYAAFGNETETRLIQLSSQDGDTHPAATIPIGDVTAMAFSANDWLYLATSSGRLYRLETMTSEPILVGTTRFAFTGLAFSPATGALWAAAHDTVCRVDEASAEVTTIGWGGTYAARSTIAFNMCGVLYGMYGSVLATIGTVWGEWTMLGQTGVAEIKAIVMRNDVVTGEEATPGPGLTWRLEQNFPNPFNPVTLIGYEVGGDGGAGMREVRLVVYDLLGRTVSELVNERQPAGRYEVPFDATGLSSGFYIYRLTAGSFEESKRMMLIK